MNWNNEKINHLFVIKILGTKNHLDFIENYQILYIHKLIHFHMIYALPCESW
jgi:hypothetical protein